jgi:hypothetical protein
MCERMHANVRACCVCVRTCVLVLRAWPFRLAHSGFGFDLRLLWWQQRGPAVRSHVFVVRACTLPRPCWSEASSNPCRSPWMPAFHSHRGRASTWKRTGAGAHKPSAPYLDPRPCLRSSHARSKCGSVSDPDTAAGLEIQLSIRVSRAPTPPSASPRGKRLGELRLIEDGVGSEGH